MRFFLILLLFSMPAYGQTYNPPLPNWSPMGSGSPTIVTNSGAGSGASATITGTNVSGTISVATGTSPVAGVNLATVTFGGIITSAPYNCILFPQNTNSVGQAAMVYATTPTASGWSIGIGGSALPASITSYQWGYTCN